MKIKCIIIDDEELAARVIKNHLNEFPNMELVGSFLTPMEALSTIENNKIDVIFLDINMPKMSGLEFVKTLVTMPLIVITTAYREYAVESFDLNVLDYLVKPIPLGRFVKAIDKINRKMGIKNEREQEQLLSREEPFIFLRVDKKLIKFKLNDILYVESLKDYIKVYTLLGDFLVHKSMTSLMDELPQSNFIRIHRSFSIAINKVNSVEGNSVEIANRRIPIGRNYIQDTKQKIFNNKEHLG
jgi:DNA-binding LytR/AlgR family response regulator